MAHFSEFVYILPANIYFESCRLILSLTYILAVLVDFNAGSDMRGIYFDLNRYDRVQSANSRGCPHTQSSAGIV